MSRARNLFVVVSILLQACGDRSSQPSAFELRAPSLAEALAGLHKDRPLAVALETDLGTLHCSVDPTRTPHAVALFVGLARGRATFLDPVTHQPVQRPMYRNLTFHRAVPEMFIQSGDPIGDSSGNPGYRIAVEARADDVERLNRPGALVLARYTPPPGRTDPHPPPPGMVLGSQFAVLLSAMPHLAGQVSVIGECADLAIARTIAADSGKQPPHRLLWVQVL